MPAPSGLVSSVNTFTLRRRGHTSARGYAYRIAGRSLCADQPLAALEPFAAGACILPQTAPPPRIDAPERRIKGWIAGRMSALSVAWSSAGCRLSAPHGGTCTITASGSDVFCTHADNIDPDFAAGMLLGPVLCTALALQGVFCLHASAALIDGHAVLFIGESGAGKSSLAAYGEQIGAWQRVSDDVTATGKGFEVLSHFPQLKLPSGAQTGHEVPEALLLAAIYLLDVPEDAESTVSVEALSQREAAAALMRHTVAARVFSGALLAHHLDYCAALAQSVALRRIVYPHRRAAMDEVIQIVIKPIQ
jgi:hypothetical protein